MNKEIHDLMQKEPGKELKKFDDCPIEEKIERMYIVIKELRQSLSWAQRTNHELQNKILQLENHQHCANGDCVIKIRDCRESGNGATMQAQVDLLS